MIALFQALRDFLDDRPRDVELALIGGIAVSTRCEPRFTRDLDFAVAVADDPAAERYVWHLRQLGYVIDAALEHAQDRLSTVRLHRGHQGPMIDLLFAATGIEPEIVAAAEAIEIGGGLVAPVAQIGHLIAMKLLSRDDGRRVRDRDDLTKLAAIADAAEWARAETAVVTIEQRGFARGRDLVADLITLRQSV